MEVISFKFILLILKFIESDVSIIVCVHLLKYSCELFKVVLIFCETDNDGDNVFQEPVHISIFLNIN